MKRFSVLIALIALVGVFSSTIPSAAVAREAAYAKGFKLPNKRWLSQFQEDEHRLYSIRSVDYDMPLMFNEEGISRYDCKGYVARAALDLHSLGVSYDRMQARTIGYAHVVLVVDDKWVLDIQSPYLEYAKDYQFDPQDPDITPEFYIDTIQKSGGLLNYHACHNDWFGRPKWSSCSRKRPLVSIEGEPPYTSMKDLLNH